MQEQEPVIRFLESALEASAEVARLRRRVQEMDSRAKRMTAQLSGMPGCGGRGQEELWASLADERERAAFAEINELERYRAVEQFIGRIPAPPVQRALLRYRYLENLRGVDNVQKALQKDDWWYSTRHIDRLQQQALDAARAQWAEDHLEVSRDELHP